LIECAAGAALVAESPPCPPGPPDDEQLLTLPTATVARKAPKTGTPQRLDSLLATVTPFAIKPSAQCRRSLNATNSRLRATIIHAVAPKRACVPRVTYNPEGLRYAMCQRGDDDRRVGEIRRAEVHGKASGLFHERNKPHVSLNDASAPRVAHSRGCSHGTLRGRTARQKPSRVGDRSRERGDACSKPWRRLDLFVTNRFSTTRIPSRSLRAK